jgi:hypothetical protein
VFVQIDAQLLYVSRKTIQAAAEGSSIQEGPRGSVDALLEFVQAEFADT